MKQVWIIWRGLRMKESPMKDQRFVWLKSVEMRGRKRKEKKGLSPELRSRLLKLRKKKKYTQIRVQTLTGVDQSNYSKLERGELPYSFEQCRMIALAMNTSMDYLAGLTDRKEPHKRIKSIE